MVHFSEANHPCWRLISWTVQYLGANLPHYMPESWTVHILSTNLPTKPLEQTKSAKAPSGAARRNAKRWPEAMVRPERPPPSWGQGGNQNSHQAPREGMRRVGRRRWCERYVFIVMERGCRNGTSFLRTRPSQTAFGPLPLVPRAASPAK